MFVKLGCQAVPARRLIIFKFFRDRKFSVLCIRCTYLLYLLSASVEDPTRPPVVGRLRSSPVLS